MTCCTSKNSLNFYETCCQFKQKRGNYWREVKCYKNCTKPKEQLTKQECDGKEPGDWGGDGSSLRSSTRTALQSVSGPNRRLCCFLPWRPQQKPDVLMQPLRRFPLLSLSPLFPCFHFLLCPSHCGKIQICSLVCDDLKILVLKANPQRFSPEC